VLLEKKLFGKNKEFFKYFIAAERTMKILIRATLFPRKQATERGGQGREEKPIF